MSNEIELAKEDLIKTTEKMRSKIIDLEKTILASGQSIHIEPKHYFANNLYAREISIPKGIVLTGKIHKTEHLCVLSKGKVSVWTDEGMKTLEASSVVHSMPGIKRVLYAHEDSVWINFHHNPTNEKDPEEIEKIFVVNTFEELEAKEIKNLEEGK